MEKESATEELPRYPNRKPPPRHAMSRSRERGLPGWNPGTEMRDRRGRNTPLRRLTCSCDGSDDAAGDGSDDGGGDGSGDDSRPGLNIVL